MPNVWRQFGPTAPSGPTDHRWRIDSDFVRQGKYSLRIELRPGDDSRKGPSERAEIVGMNDASGNEILINEKSGTYYLAFSVRLAPNWKSPLASDTPSDAKHGIFLQLHKVDSLATTGPAFSFQVFDSFFIRTNTGNIHNPIRTDYQLLNKRLNKGSWIDFVLKIKLATDSSGEIMLWRRDQGKNSFALILSLKKLATLLYDSTSAGKKMIPFKWHTGYYRDKGSTVTNILWLDGFTLARSGAAAQVNAFNTVADLPGDDSLGTLAAMPSVLTNVSVIGDFIAHSLAGTDNDVFTVHVFPNPSSNKFSLIVASKSNKKIQIVVTDVYGRKVYQTESNSDNSYAFGEAFSSGVYFIQIMQGENINMLKLIKEK